jgi:hypothetical protein
MKTIEEMTPDELKEYEETLNRELKVRDLKRKAEMLAEEKKMESTKAEQARLEQLKAEALTSIYAEHPELKPKIKIADAGSSKMASAWESHYNSYFDRHKDVTTHGLQTHKLTKDIPDVQFQLLNAGKPGVCGFGKIFENTDSDTGCEDVVDAWSPADTYAKIIWNTFVCKADLFDLVVKGIAINPGDGLSVQIRTYGAFGTPSELGACECGSCATITLSTYTLTLKQYNLEAVLCEKDIWDVGGVLMDSYIDSMSDSWAAFFDYQIYSELESASPGNDIELDNALACSASLVTDGCCIDQSLYDLYNAVIDAKVAMKEGTNPYKPDYIIMSPSVAAIFKRMQSPTPMPWVADVKFSDDGDLIKIGGLKVVEYCRATACTDGTGEVVAIVIDSRRAVGAVFGERPKMYKEFQQNCNSYRIDWWSFFACGELDTNAITHITNP